MMTITTIGRITKDLELKTSEKSGCVYVNFSLAVNEGFGDNQKTTFFDCVVFGVDAERLIKAKAKKGSLLHVTGKFGTSEFTRTNGEPGHGLRITVLAWSYIPGTGGQKDGNGNNGNGNGDNGNGNRGNNNANVPAGHADEGYVPNGDIPNVTDLDEEDMPF